MMYRSKKKSNLGKFLLMILLMAILVALVIMYILKKGEIGIKYNDLYVASDNNVVDVYELNEDELIKKDSLVRGTKLKVSDRHVEYNGGKYYMFSDNDNNYYINDNNLVKDTKDIVKEKNMYVKIATYILEDLDRSDILTSVKKEDKLDIIGYDKLNKDGSVNNYKVSINDKEGYISGNYVVHEEDDSKVIDNIEYYNIHKNVKNLYGGGDASKLDYSSSKKVEFPDNKMPKNVYALYLNGGSDVIKNIDSYIEFAKDTKINAFVVDIKDNETPCYPADVFKKISPTNYEHAINDYDSYKNAIKKLKDANFYVIGRITTFKDSFYVEDNKEKAITSKLTNSPFMHNRSYWPSAYDRSVWSYNVALAIESVKKFGFNEINFDYVRFPDRMQSVENSVDLHNNYNEDKIEAIQNFVRYATDELHKINTYVSIDVFGETTTNSYTTAYGQYWPGISNICDVISAMPYPDHFGDNYYGISKPWNNPYKLLYTWAKYASDRQKETPTPAVARTWIQAYDVMKYVDRNGISYGASEVESEIRALYEGGLNGGYITWLSNSSLSKYKTQKKAFQIDYGSEYDNEN